MDTRIIIRWLVAIVGLIAVLGATVLLWRGWDMRRSAADHEAQGAGRQAWEDLLDGYLDLLSQDDGRMTFLEATAPATRPERFVAHMSRFTWHSDAGLADDIAADTRELIYPPTELHCALLTHAVTTDPDLDVPDDHEVVLVARHQDRDRSVWVGHRIADPQDDVATRQVLNEVGCPLTW